MKLFSTVPLLLLLLSMPLFAQENISVESTVDKQTITIGDIIRYTVTITADTSIVVDSLVVGTNLGGFEVKDYTPRSADVKAGKRISSESFDITTFTTGDYQIPPVTIQYQTPDGQSHVITTDAMPIKVNSLLTGEEGEDIKPLRGPKQFEEKVPLWIIIAGASLLIGIALFLYFFRRASKPIDLGKEPVDTRLPWEIALAELDELKRSDLLGKGEYKLYYLRLSEIFRGYLERRYGISALERTTHEIILEFRALSLDKGEEQTIGKFLDECDLVKFAKYDPTSADIERDFQTAREFVLQTRSLPYSTTKVDIKA